MLDRGSASGTWSKRYAALVWLEMRSLMLPRRFAGHWRARILYRLMHLEMMLFLVDRKREVSPRHAIAALLYSITPRAEEIVLPLRHGI